MQTSEPVGAAVSFPTDAATDAVTASPTRQYSRESGSIFPRGTTPVTVTATDAAGNVATCSFDVTVQATGPLCGCGCGATSPGAAGAWILLAPRSA